MSRDLGTVEKFGSRGPIKTVAESNRSAVALTSIGSQADRGWGFAAADAARRGDRGECWRIKRAYGITRALCNVTPKHGVAGQLHTPVGTVIGLPFVDFSVSGCWLGQVEESGC